MNAWIQHADYTDESVNVGSLDMALSIWQAINAPSEDQLMQELESRGEEFCPWGYGITGSDKGPFSFHAYRESPEDDTFAVRFQKNYLDKTFEGLQSSEVESNIEQYFNDPDAIFG